MRSAVHYVRTTPDRRISFGLGGMQPNLARRIGPRFAYDPRAIEIAIADLHRMFPGFVDVPIEAGVGWADRRLRPPPAHIRDARQGERPLRARLHRRRVGPAHLGGHIMADPPEGGPGPRPARGSRALRFPPEPVRSPGALVANTAIRRKDEAEDDGEEPNPLIDFVASSPASATTSAPRPNSS